MAKPLGALGRVLHCRVPGDEKNVAQRHVQSPSQKPIAERGKAARPPPARRERDVAQHVRVEIVVCPRRGQVDGHLDVPLLRVFLPPTQIMALALLALTR